MFHLFNKKDKPAKKSCCTIQIQEVKDEKETAEVCCKEEKQLSPKSCC